jgi:heterodisulfide reductase subunit A
MGNSRKIGVYVCHCGGNISEVVDVKAVSDFAGGQDGVVLNKDYSHLCSDLGQKMIAEDIRKNNLDGVVVSACSYLFHGETFKKAAEAGGMNPYMLEMANIREHCAWAHSDTPDIATEKAKDIVNMGIGKVRRNAPLEPVKISIDRNVLIIGGGIAGIQAALDLGEAGFNVSLLEQKATIGGRMAQLSRTFPTNDCAACILGAKMSDISRNGNITLYTYSEIEDISGYIGNFSVKIRRKATFVDDSCLSCGICTEACPVSLPDEYQWGVTERKAIYQPLDYAVPNKYLIDESVCLNIRSRKKTGNTDVCRKCEAVCPRDSIHFDRRDRIEEIKADTIIVATGYDVFDAKKKPEYGYGRFRNVMIAPEVERLIVHTGEGRPTRDLGKRVAFIQCVGSRDEQLGREYCSRVCCMYATKLAQLIRHIASVSGKEKDIYVFYTDMRTFGKGYEEYYKDTMKMGVKYVRGRPGEITENPETRKVTIRVEDTLTRSIMETEFDTVVLSVGLEASAAGARITEMLKLPKSSDGFLQEAHPKFRPVDTQTEGVFIAGTAQGPKDIPDTVAQASATAARAMRLMVKGYMETEPVKAFVHPDLCDGCGDCVAHCPGSALSMADAGEGAGNPAGRQIVEVNESICKGCGLCIGTCHSEALDLHLFTNEQLLAEVEGALANRKPGEKRVILFADTMCTYKLADTVGTGKKAYADIIRIIRVPSSSRVSPELIIRAFALGADGVFLGDCEAKSTSYPGSIEYSQETVKKVKSILKGEGINPERLMFFQFATVMIPKFVMLMNRIAGTASGSEDIPEELRNSLPDKARKTLFPGGKK